MARGDTTIKLFSCLLMLASWACTSSITSPSPHETSSPSYEETTTGNNQKELKLSLNISDTFYVHKISHMQIKQMDIQYEVTFNREKGSPVIYFFAQTPNSSYESTHIIHQCFVGGSGFANVALLSHYFIYMKETSIDGFTENNRNLTYSGKQMLAYEMPRTWWFAVGYPCENQQLLQMDIIMNFTFNAPATCEAFTSHRCSTTFNQTTTAFPNRVGHSRQSDAAKLFRTLDPLVLENCYQHMLLVLCKSLFHDCIGDSIYLPCRQMCIDFVNGCKDTLERWNQKITCGNFQPSLDPNVCLYKPVVCPSLLDPDHGLVVNEGQNLSDIAKYECNPGYELEGPSVRRCLHSGEWNGTEPLCLMYRENGPESPIMSPEWLSIIILSIILTFIVLSICIQHRRSLHLLILYNLYINRKLRAQVNDERKRLFLSYSSLDSLDIEDNFLAELKLKLPSWTVTVFEQDFTPGGSLIDTITESIWQSQAVLVMLTENYINSEWCEYEFSEAITRSVKDEEFRLIIIIKQQDGKNLMVEKMPKHLKSFMKTTIYLKVKERLFWNKLRRGLAE